MSAIEWSDTYQFIYVGYVNAIHSILMFLYFAELDMGTKCILDMEDNQTILHHPADVKDRLVKLLKY